MVSQLLGRASVGACGRGRQVWWRWGLWAGLVDVRFWAEIYRVLGLVCQLWSLRARQVKE
nr:MAG TPA: hypothetical protein [Caudoviricetes sp.]